MRSILIIYLFIFIFPFTHAIWNIKHKGGVTNPSKYPYVVRLQLPTAKITEGRSTKYVEVGRCTGTFIAPRLILTAGHCLEHFCSSRKCQIDDIKIYTRSGKKIHAKKCGFHPGRTIPQKTQYDIGMIYVDEPEEGSPWVKISPHPSWVGQKLKLVGYGKSDCCGDAELRAEGNTLAEGINSINQIDLKQLVMKGGIDKPVSGGGDSGGPAFSYQLAPKSAKARREELMVHLSPMRKTLNQFGIQAIMKAGQSGKRGAHGVLLDLYEPELRRWIWKTATRFAGDDAVEWPFGFSSPMVELPKYYEKEEDCSCED